MKDVIILTGPQGSGNHLFSKIFEMHPSVKGWAGINTSDYLRHDDEPYNKIWRDVNAIEDIDWSGEYHVISISCPYVDVKEKVVPNYKEVVEALQAKGFNVRIGIIGRDQNIIEHQQLRLRKRHSTQLFLDEIGYLTSLPHTFLSFEMAMLYKEDYIKTVGKDLCLPVLESSPLYEEIFSVNSNKAYLCAAEEGHYDEEVIKSRIP